MARYIYQSKVTDGNGKVLQSGTITIYEEDGTTPATVYAAEVGGAAVTYVTSDDNGHFYFWVDTADYNSLSKFTLVISKTNFASKTYEEIMVTMPGDVPAASGNDKYLKTNSVGTAYELADLDISDDPSPQFSATPDLNGNGLLTSSGGATLSSAELSYLDGSTAGGYTTASAEFAAEARQALTTSGDILYASGVNTLSRLAKGTASQALLMNTAATAPTWVSITSPTIINTESTINQTPATGSTVMVWDDTTPQNDEGDEYMTCAITPTSATNILSIEVSINLSHGSNSQMIAALFQDSTANALASGNVTVTAADMIRISFLYEMVAGTTSETTFKVRAGSNAGGTTGFNRRSSGTYLNGTMVSSIKITERTP